MKDAVLALGMGGPDSVSAIEPFLRNLLNDREIINFGMGATLQRFVANKIAKSRSVKVAPHYEKMGGGSPQYRLTKALLDKVPPLYKARTGRELDTFIGMCYWHPFIEDSVTRLLEADSRGEYRSIYLLPLYPQYSSTTTGPCFSRVHKATALRPTLAPLTRINQFHTFGPYLHCTAQRVQQAADKLGVPVNDVHLLYSAHSLPQSVVDNGDPYVRQLTQQIALLNDLVKPASYSLAYQSKLGKMKWLTPPVMEEFGKLAKDGKKNIIVLAVSFINDHIETLIELDDDLIPRGRSLGLRIERAPCLNDGDDFAAAVADLLENA